MLRLKFVLPILTPALVLALAWVCLALTRGPAGVAAVWPVNALVLALLVRWARRPDERAYVLILSWIAMAGANAIVGSPLTITIGLPTLSLVEVLIAAWLLRGNADPTASLRSFAAFVGGPVLAAPAAAGALAALFCVAVLGPDARPMEVFLRWVAADALGMAIAGGFLLTIGRPAPASSGKSEWLRFGIAQAAVLAASCQMFLFSDRPPLFLIFPFLVAAAMSHRQLGGVTAVVIASLLATVATLDGRGPATVGAMSGFDPVLLMQIYLASMVFTVLPVSALLQRLETARTRAEELSEIRTRLLAQVSHEIRSPLAGVTTLAELMRDGALGELTPSQKETMSQIASSGAEASELARDLTDAAALQSGNASVRLVEVEVREAIRAAVAQAQFRASQHRATIETAPGEADDLKVLADPLRLRQILVNLLINAAKYGGSPPRVLVGARLVSEGVVRFEVSDNGDGVGAGQRDALFQDFQRLGAENSDVEGMGLGLALSRQIAHLQNGRVGLEDGALGGACFWLELPISARDATAA